MVFQWISNSVIGIVVRGCTSFIRQCTSLIRRCTTFIRQCTTPVCLFLIRKCTSFIRGCTTPASPVLALIGRVHDQHTVSDEFLECPLHGRAVQAPGSRQRRLV